MNSKPRLKIIELRNYLPLFFILPNPLLEKRIGAATRNKTGQ